MKKENDNKPLYTYEGEVDSYEYKKMAKYFPQRIYWVFVVRGLYWDLILSAVIAITSKSLFETLVVFLAMLVYILIISKVRLESFAEKLFNEMKKKNNINTKFKTEVYDNYFIKRNESMSFTIQYSDISKCIETDTNFYLEYPQQKSVIIIKKENCELDLINFIRKTFKSLENHLGDKTKFKGVKEYHNPDFIRKGMIILFVLTIASLWGAAYSIEIVNHFFPLHGLNLTKHMWVFWCWLPIPLLSIGLGSKYKKAGFKCTKNIVAGCIITFFLVVYGAFSVMPTFSENYNKINDYKDIISAELPNSGTLDIQNWGTYFDDDKTEYTIINVYYDKENVEKLVDSIENNEKWILSKEIKTDLKVFIPSQLRSDDDAYYSIYNKTTNQYNLLPEVSGNYEVYAMKYDKSDKHLEIHKFKIMYNK